jgi:hypothetical protein
MLGQKPCNNGEIVWITRDANINLRGVWVYSQGKIRRLDSWTCPYSGYNGSGNPTVDLWAQINDAGQVLWGRYDGDVNKYMIYISTPVKSLGHFLPLLLND